MPRSYATDLLNYENSGTLEVAGLNMNGTDLSPTTAGTVDASSMVIVDANKDIDGFRHVTATGTVDAGDLAVDGTTIGSTPAEIDLQCDASLQTETIDVSTAISVTKRITKIVSSGAGAVTIAAPHASMLGMVKIIEHTGGYHDVTLDLTNVQGQSAGTTATFSDAHDTLVLVAGTGKWNVISESGVAMS